MTTPFVSSLKNYLLRLRAATEKWYAQVFLYLVLVVVFFVIDQVFVADYYRKHFYSPGAMSNWLFLSGEWIPAFANVVAILMVVRARSFLGYSIVVLLLTYLLAIAYFFLGGLAAVSNNPMDGPGVGIFWMMANFWSGVAGFVIRITQGEYKWHTNSK